MYTGVDIVESEDHTSEAEVRTKYRYVFDETRWPIVIARSPAEADESQIDQESFYEECDRLLGEGRPFLMIQDLRGVPLLGPARRRRFAQYANTHIHQVRDVIGGFAVLLDSPIMRGVVTAVLWFVTPPCPVKVFTKPTDAENWLLSLDATARTESKRAS